MLTNADVKKVIDANKEVFATKVNILNVKDELVRDFSNLQSSVDGYAKKANTY